MGSGIDFAGQGAEDANQGPTSTGYPESARRGANGPIDLAGDGAMDVGGTIDTTHEKGSMPGGPDIQFAGNGSEDA